MGTLRLQPARLMCDASGCTADKCCLAPTTTPCPTTVYPAPAPCSTKMMRLYSAKQEATVQEAVVVAHKGTTPAQAWAVPIISMCAMLTLAVGVGATLYRRSALGGTREVRSREPSTENGPLLF